MGILDLLGLGRTGASSDAKGMSNHGDTDTVRRIVGELERMNPDRARFLAAFAYVLSRVASADYDVDAGYSSLGSLRIGFSTTFGSDLGYTSSGPVTVHLSATYAVESDYDDDTKLDAVAAALYSLTNDFSGIYSFFWSDVSDPTTIWTDVTGPTSIWSDVSDPTTTWTKVDYPN